MDDDTLGLTIVCSLVLLVICVCVSLGIWASHRENTLAISHGLQQCQAIGDRTWHWRKECR